MQLRAAVLRVICSPFGVIGTLATPAFSIPSEALTTPKPYNRYG
jgi:hypothetical protein